MTIQGNRLQQYWRGPGWKTAWSKEVERRISGHEVRVDDNFFFHTNPLFEPALAMTYTAGRYAGALEVLAELRPKSVLEIGCAHGLGTWLMKDYAERCVGVDIAQSRIDLGSKIFPEIELVAEDFAAYLASLNGQRFDVMINSHGPVRLPDRIFDYCDHYIYIGYRPKTLGEMLSGSHKLPGRQISHSTTWMSRDGQQGLSSNYVRHFFSRDWLMTARHAVTHGYWLPI